MTKVAIKSENITPYGGIFHVMDTFSKLGLGKLIESTLGQRGNTGKRLKNFMLHFICVPAKWIKTGRSHVLNLYTTKDYYSDIFRE